MKILLLVLTGIATAFASGSKSKKTFSRPYGMAGCGLGSLVIPKQGSQVFAGTTNGTSSNQYFGITFGTSNCVDNGTGEVAHRMDQYIHVNKSQLAGDVAKGQGETIVALGQVMGCQPQAPLASALKAHYQDIFNGDQTTNIVTDNIITVIQNDESLSTQCKTQRI